MNCLAIAHALMLAYSPIPNHAVNTDAHRQRFAPWWPPVTLVR